MKYAAARRNMVDNHIRPNKVTDPLILSAMNELPREIFVPPTMAGVAYVDDAIKLGNGRFFMEPMVLARLLQAAQVMPDDVVLDIGCTSAYGSAILARMASTVVALESEPSLAAIANKTIIELGLDNVAVVEGPLDKGYGKQAPYDVIIINGAIPDIPTIITDQLAEGGRLLTIISDGPIGKGVLAKRNGNIISRNELFNASAPALPGFLLAN